MKWKIQSSQQGLTITVVHPVFSVDQCYVLSVFDLNVRLYEVAWREISQHDEYEWEGLDVALSN
jgi:hypothetical protein